MGNNLHEIIEQIKKDLYCPVCGKNYDIDEIRLRGLFDHTLIIQTVCVNGHMTLFVTTYKRKDNLPAINTNDVIELHRSLEKFDGDFEKKWKTN